MREPEPGRGEGIIDKFNRAARRSADLLGREIRRSWGSVVFGTGLFDRLKEAHNYQPENRLFVSAKIFALAPLRTTIEFCSEPSRSP